MPQAMHEQGAELHLEPGNLVFVSGDLTVSHALKSQHFWLLVLPFALYHVAFGPSWEKLVSENIAQLFKAFIFIVVLGISSKYYQMHWKNK